MLTLEQQKRLILIDAEIEKCKLYAQYWLAMANTGAATRKILQKRAERSESIYHCDDPSVWQELTDEEKIDDALNTATSFISRLDFLVSNKIKVLENKLDELE